MIDEKQKNASPYLSIKILFIIKGIIITHSRLFIWYGTCNCCRWQSFRGLSDLKFVIDVVFCVAIYQYSNCEIPKIVKTIISFVIFTPHFPLMHSSPQRQAGPSPHAQLGGSVVISQTSALLSVQ